MKIQASQLNFSSKNKSQTKTLRIGQTTSRAAVATPRATMSSAPISSAQLSSTRRSLDSLRQSQHCQTSSATSAEGKQIQHAVNTSEQAGLRRFIEQQSVTLAIGSVGNTASMPASATQAYFLHESSESAHYQLQGELSLDDGRQINFNVTGNMSRSLRIEEGSGVYAGKLERKDPLILNYGSTSAQLTEKAFAFDIDADGEDDHVSFATQGSGFLFIDRNNNGTLDDGNELFGTKSGNGFADLARHDDDGNGFIDSNDNIYQQLKLLSRNENGDDTITTLAAAGVGALGLESVATEFELTNDWQQSRGRLRATGVAVGEDGRVMTLQQVDLTQRSLASEAQFRSHFEMHDLSGDNEGVAGDAVLSVRQALERLQEMTEKMQAAMAEVNSSKADAKEPPKSLMELLVDRFFPSEEDPVSSNVKS
jgi:hypothetical protein